MEMSKKKFKWNPYLNTSDDSLLDTPEEETQMADDMSPVEQFISWSVAEDTPAKGENLVASIEATPRAPTAKELARLNRFPPA
jgi:hypothetical protein